MIVLFLISCDEHELQKGREGGNSRLCMSDSSGCHAASVPKHLAFVQEHKCCCHTIANGLCCAGFAPRCTAGFHWPARLAHPS